MPRRRPLWIRQSLNHFTTIASLYNTYRYIIQNRIELNCCRLLSKYPARLVQITGTSQRGNVCGTSYCDCKYRRTHAQTPNSTPPRLHRPVALKHFFFDRIESNKTKWLSSFPAGKTRAFTQQSHIHNDTHISSGSTEDVVSTGRSDKERLVPNRGMASDTWGKVSATRFRNTVNESKMVTPATEHSLNTAISVEIAGNGSGECYVGIWRNLCVRCLLRGLLTSSAPLTPSAQLTVRDVD